MEAPRSSVTSPFLAPQRESPFLSEYSDDEELDSDATSEMLEALFFEIYEPELDEAVEMLVAEASDSLPASGAEDGEVGGHAEAVLAERLAPLARAAEGYLDRVAAKVGSLEAAGATEAEVFGAIDREPVDASGSPSFELFLGGLAKKLKKVASKAVSLAKKGVSLAGGVLLKPVIAKLKTLVRPLLDKVVKFALDKIPAPYRPFAQKLAQSLGVKATALAEGVLDRATRATGAAPPTTALQARPTSVDEPQAPPELTPHPDAPQPPDEPAVPDTSQAQQELDLQLAELLFSGDPVDHEVIGRAPAAWSSPASDPYAELDRARDRFQREILALEEAAEAGPAIERFVPAVLMAVRTGIRLLGRPKVIGFLGGLIGKLVAPLVGKNNAPGLGKALADIGLRSFLQAEVDEETQRELAGEVLASTVEETGRRVASLPDAILGHTQLLEAYAVEAFQGAAAANFPMSLVRPDLRESESPGAWVLLPARSRRRYYKKYTRVFDVAISPSSAAAVRSYDGSTLASFFRDRLRLPTGATIRARVHVYEAIPRTRLSRISRSEDVRGLGSSERAIWTQMHPLTPEAAALLLGAPRLGRELDEAADPSVPAVGQRYYYLELPEAPPRPVGQESHLHIGVDLRNEEIHVCMYLSEVLAQKVATALRKQLSAGAIVAELRSALSHASSALTSQRLVRLVRIRGARQNGKGPHGPVAQGARQALRREIGALALQWVWAHLAEQLGARAQEIIQKTEGPEDGLRLSFTFLVHGGLSPIKKVLRGAALSLPQWPPKQPARVHLSIAPGYRRGC